MRDVSATNNLIAVSANNRETAINVEQTLDTTMIFNMDNVVNLDPRRTTNEGQATGKEEVDTIYDLGALSRWPFSQEMAQPQHYAFILAYLLGSCSSAALGDGYKHTFLPISGDLDASRSNPGFTVAQRLGQTVLKRRFASLFADEATFRFPEDDWPSVSGSAIGTGKVTDNVTAETITAGPDAVSLTLAALGVEGATAAARLDNVQRIRVQLTSGVWTDVSYSAVSDATPAVITIAAPGAAGDDVTYEVLFIPAESGWMTFPSRVTESPLRISAMTLTWGGTWNGTTFAGGRDMSSLLKSLEWTVHNNMQLKFVPGAGGSYASRAVRGGRAQTISFTRELRDYILQAHIDDNDTFGLHIKLTGDLLDDTYYYQTEIVFPRLGVLKAPISVDGKRLAEAGDLQVLEDDTYGSVIAYVQNLVATYAA